MEVPADELTLLTPSDTVDEVRFFCLVLAVGFAVTGDSERRDLDVAGSASEFGVCYETSHDVDVIKHIVLLLPDEPIGQLEFFIFTMYEQNRSATPNRVKGAYGTLDSVKALCY